MGIRETFKKAIHGVTDWCCAKSSWFRQPKYHVTRDYRDATNEVLYIAQSMAGKQLGNIAVRTGETPSVTLDGPYLKLEQPPYEVFERLTVNAQGSKSCLLVYPDSHDSKQLLGTEVPKNTLSQIWKYAHMSLSKVISKDGLPDNHGMQETICFVATAYDRRVRAGDFLARFGL